MVFSQEAQASPYQAYSVAVQGVVVLGAELLLSMSDISQLSLDDDRLLSVGQEVPARFCSISQSSSVQVSICLREYLPAAQAVSVEVEHSYPGGQSTAEGYPPLANFAPVTLYLLIPSSQ